MKGATLPLVGFNNHLHFQSTLPVKGATSAACKCGFMLMDFSIHAPREGSDMRSALQKRRELIFQSTLPVKGATYIDFVPEINQIFQSTLPVKGATLWASQTG